MERPAIGWSTFMVFDFMRVPPPAARTMTVRFSMGRSLSLPAPAQTCAPLWSNGRVSGRSYGGESATDRLARRRRQLLDAGLELFGTAGYRATTVRQLCREAKVSDRYFYEQFDSTEDLLLAVYDECTARLEEAAVAALGDPGDAVQDLARRGLDAFLSVVESDPRLARVVWFEVLGVSPRVETAYLARMQSFGHLMVAVVAGREEAADVPDGDARADGHHGRRGGQLHRDDLGQRRLLPRPRGGRRDAGPVPGRGGDGRAGGTPVDVTCVTHRCGIDCLHSNVMTTDSGSEERWTPRPC